MRITLGASLTRSTQFALMPNSNSAKPVALPPGAAKLPANPGTNRIMSLVQANGNDRVRLLGATGRRPW